MSKAPDVSVIVAVYNGMPYLRETIDSVMAQTIGRERLQVLVVDDGSTDGTAAYLDERAARESVLEVIHQPNSGGPATPRNRALEHVRGRYVFFLDGDDTLAPRALEVAVAYADGNKTDVVLLRMRGTGGRTTPRAQFTRTVPRGDVFSTSAYWSLNPMKLYRTSLIREHGLTFPVDMPWGEDQPFVARALLLANAISVVSDRDYVLWRRRDDASNISYVAVSLADRMPVADRMFDLVAEHVPPGAARDRLMARHFAIELVDCALPGYRDCPDEAVRHAAFERFRTIVASYLTPEIERGLSPHARIAIGYLREGDEASLLGYLERARDAADPEPVVEGASIYLPLPGFREGDPRLPDEVFEIGSRLKAKCRLETVRVSRAGLRLTIEARVAELTGQVTGAELVVRSKDRIEATVPLKILWRDEIVHGKPRPWILIDETIPPRALLSALPSGAYDLDVRFSAAGLTRSCRLAECAPAPRNSRHLLSLRRRPVVGTLHTTAHGNLSLRVSHSIREVARVLARSVRRAIARR